MGAIEVSGRAAKSHIGNGSRRDDTRGHEGGNVGNRAGAGQCSKGAELRVRMSAGVCRQARMANLQRKRAIARRHISGRDHRLKQQRQEHGAGNQAAICTFEAKSCHATTHATRRSGGASITKNDEAHRVAALREFLRAAKQSGKFPIPTV
jgi:hypothetical protein